MYPDNENTYFVNITHYLNDVSGNVLSIYTDARLPSVSPKVNLEEQTILGAGRIGVIYTRTDQTVYEITDHLGNVRVVVTDRKNAVLKPAVKKDNFETSIGNWMGSNNNNGLQVENNKLKVTYVGAAISGSGAFFSASVTAGKTYVWKFDLEIGTVPSVYYYAVMGSNPFVIKQVNESGSYTVRFTAPSTGTVNLKAEAGPASTYQFWVDNSIFAEEGSFEPEIISAETYYPFGMAMPGRRNNNDQYRFGFNGKENDNEVKGTGNSIDFGDRMQDPRLGRWLSIDAKAAKYPNISPYVFAANNPIYYLDPDGNDVEVYVTATKVGTTKINLYSAGEIKKDASLKNKTAIVAVYEVQVKNESGSSATFYFTRTGYRGKSDGSKEDVTFDVRDDKGEFLGQVKSRWGGTDNVLELRDKDDISDQSVEGMKGDVEAIRTAVQFHLKGATDGCLLCVGKEQFESKEENATIDETNLENNSGDTQANFMNTIKDFKAEDKKAGKGDKVIVKFDKLNNSSDKSVNSKKPTKKEK